MNKRIALTFKENGENGGPFTSHKRIQDSALNNKYDFIPLTIPRARVLLKPSGMMTFVKKIKDCQVGAVQIAGLQLDGILTLYACKKAGVKSIVAIHGRMTESPSIKGLRRVFYEVGEKWTVNNADVSFGVSDYVGSWKICNDAPKYFGTVYNLPPKTHPLDTRLREQTRKRLGFKETDIVFISTGRITEEKGFDTLGKAIENINPKLHVKFLIVGDGSYLQSWKKEVCVNGYSDRVVFVGYQKNVDVFLNAADAFIICSKHETLCISLLEAAMHRLPLIGSDVGGIPEIINDKDGILVPVNDVAGFSHVIELLADDAQKRTALGQAAFEYVTSKFNEVDILQKLDDIYTMVLKDEIE